MHCIFAKLISEMKLDDKTSVHGWLQADTLSQTDISLTGSNYTVAAVSQQCEIPNYISVTRIISFRFNLELFQYNHDSDWQAFVILQHACLVISLGIRFHRTLTFSTSFDVIFTLFDIGVLAAMARRDCYQ